MPDAGVFVFVFAFDVVVKESRSDGSLPSALADVGEVTASDTASDKGKDIETGINLVSNFWGVKILHPFTSSSAKGSIIEPFFTLIRVQLLNPLSFVGSFTRYTATVWLPRVGLL
jgi:hypothetical protein